MSSLRAFLIRQKIRALYLYWRVKFFIWPTKMPQNTDGKVYLNLGCGVNTSAEFVNIDAIPFAHTHLVANIQDLSMFPSNSVDMIYASHVIEHIPRNNLAKTLREWNRVLKHGGTLRFGVPNFDSLIEIYKLNDNNTDSIVDQLLGQDGEYDDHHTIWNRAYANKMLKAAGFQEAIDWTPETADHHDFQDKSNRHYVTKTGVSIPISLNLEARKA